MKNTIYFNKPLQNDDIFVKNSILPITDFITKPTRKGLDNVILSENRIVNIVSNSYSHLPNQDFFYKVEEMLICSNINYSCRSINRDNRSFAVDYILDNEFFELKAKFNILADFKIENPEEIIKRIADETKLFKYECSDKNDLPSLNARTILQTIEKEQLQLNEDPNMWLVYNAFNELLHNKIKKTFDQQQKIDKTIFNLAFEMTN